MRIIFRRIFVFCVAFVCLWSCINVPKQTRTSFETLTLSRQSITVPTSWSATLVGRNDVKIIPQISGQLMKVSVIEGQKVSKGQTLFVIDQRSAALALETAKANLAAAQAQMSTAKLEYESNKNLYAKKIVSDYMLNASLNDYNTAVAAVQQAKAAVSNASLELSHCTVKSPVDGKVGSIPVNPGDMVSPASLLTTVAGDSEMTAKFSFTETQVQDILKEGLTMQQAVSMLPAVRLHLKDGSIYAHEGKVTSVSGVVDQSMGTVVCRATFPNPDGLLYSGIQGSVVMDFQYDSVIVVPLTAIVRLQDKSILYRVKDDKAESVIVKIAEIGNGKDAAVLEGIEPGETIVKSGAANVFDGAQVIFHDAQQQ